MTGARLASGPPSARIVVVVDSARKWDVIKEGLLVGPAGSRFEEWLQGVGLRRQDVYITTLVTERVTKDNLRTKPKAEVAYAVELLHQRLAALQDPWVIVPMDEVALTALTGKRKLSKWRGSILQYTDSRGRAIKVIPTLHPQETFRAPALERWCRYDWARIAGDSQFRELRLPERALHIRPTLRDVQAFVRDLPAFEAVSLDIETPRQIVLREKVLKSGKTKVSKAYGPSRITCIAFAPAANWAICVPTTLDYWGNKADLALVWQHVRDICGHRVPKVLQNGLFDRYHLKRERDIDVVNHLWDTLCLSHAYDSASKHSLAKLASVWTREPYWKDDAKDLDDDDGECDFEDVKSIDDFWRYNCVEESTPVLTADFTWKPIKDITTGEQILSVDEHGGQQNKGEGSRRWRVATVTKTAAARKACLEIITKSGRRLVLTPDHKVLVGNSGKYWVDAGDLRCTPKFKSQLMQAVEPWADDLSWDRAWFGGFLDGEGSVGGTRMLGGQDDKHQGYGSVSFAQNPGAVFDRAVRVLASHGFKASYRGPCKSTGNVHYGYIRNGARNTIRLLGMFKPTRLQENYKRIMEAGHIRAVCLDGDQIVSIKKIGVRNVVDITTTTSTFIANGYVVHNCRDAAVTYEIKDRIVPVLEADGLLAKYHQHYPPLFDPLLKMMLDGVRQDPHTKAAHLQQLEVDLRAHRADLDAETTANVRYKDGTPYGKSIIATKAISNKLLQEVLYDVLRLPKREKTRKDTGEKTTTADSVALRSLALRHKATCGRLVELILAYRRTGKIKDFIKEGVADADHRVRCQYKFTTESHRLASSKNPGRTGQNLQNVDRSVRRHYLSDPGTVFIELDASQAEDRIVKVQGYLLTGNKDLLWRARAQPWENDEHKRAAAAIFNVPVDHVTKQQRTLGKTSRHACHDDQTEVLTETGWMSFPEYVKRPVPIAEWQADDNTIAFKAPSQVHQYDFDGELHTFDAKGFSQHVTGNHRMRYHRPSANRDHAVVAEAATLTDKTRLHFQTAGFYTGTQRLDPAFARLLVATQADGCIRDRTHISFRFKRRRKIERLRTLLASLNIDGHERCTADGVTQFTLCKNDALPVIAWLGPEKVYGAWLLQLDAATLDCMLAELVHWDGHQAKTSLIYWSVKRVNVDWIQTIAHLRGVRSLIRACHGCWRLYLSPVRLTSVKQVGTKTYAGKVYCVTTSTGYFMVRKNTYISISCNSNYGMGGKTHSENLLKQGVVITPDEAQTMIDAIMAADPEIAEWQRATRIAVMRDRAITNVWGWSLSFKYDRLDDAVYRRAYAYRPQSDCGIMTNINGIVPFWAWLHEQRRRTRSVAWAMTRLALQVHDAIIVCCPPETAYDVAAFIKQHLETPLPYDGGKCPLVIPATLKIGTSWEMAKEYTRFPSREELEAECRSLLAGQQALLAGAAVG